MLECTQPILVSTYYAFSYLNYVSSDHSINSQVIPMQAPILICTSIIKNTRTHTHRDIHFAKYSWEMCRARISHWLITKVAYCRLNTELHHALVVVGSHISSLIIVSHKMVRCEFMRTSTMKMC